MADLIPTIEQAAIVSAAVSSEDNLIVSALAGAAKTSTLVLLARAVKVKTLCLAFNKRIADEMRERLPLHCEAKTLNSLGHGAWGRTLGKRLNLDTRKTYRLLTEYLKSPNLSKELREEANDNFVDILHILDRAKTVGYVPDGTYLQAKRLMNDDDFFDHDLDDPVSPAMEHLIKSLVTESIDEGFQGIIDFGDQILLPTIFASPFDNYPLVLVDEAQDLSQLNHAMLRKVIKKRVIAVGDACQSIYAFRGADESSMAKLQKEFSMRELTLTISFRCPIKVVEEARWRAPAMKWPEWAKEGVVSAPGEWSIEDLTPDAVILCRNNAPLFSMAIALLREGRYPELIGNDVGKSLIRILKKLGKPDMPKDALKMAIKEWVAKKLAATRNPDRLNDQAACLMVFADAAENLGGAIAYAEKLMSIGGPVKLMTIHKSKGLEFPNVYILDRELIRDSQQDKNLLYVAQTRAKETLTYLKFENFLRLKELQHAHA